MIVTISRQMASNGELIGRLVAERLRLRYVDRELLEELARRLHVDPEVVLKFDETTLDPVQSVIAEWRTHVNEETYQHSLHGAMQQLLRTGDAVVIGRGGNYILHCPECLHVRIIAPLGLRIAIFRTQHDGSEQEAQQMIAQTDFERAQFIRQYFHREIDDPSGYDLVVNLSGLTPEMAAEIIVQAAHFRASAHLSLESRATLPQHIAIMARHRRPTLPPVLEHENRKSA